METLEIEKTQPEFKPLDYVLCKSTACYDMKAYVERITKTLVVVNNIKYRKSDGFASGESYIFSRRIEIPKDEEQIKAIKLEYRKRIIKGRG